MKTELGITKGECYNGKATHYRRILDNKYTSHVISSGNGIVSEALGKTKEEAELNGELISEAFNVANETGKTPRQLADDNKVLLEALICVRNYGAEFGMREDEFGKVVLAIKQVTE